MIVVIKVVMMDKGGDAGEVKPKGWRLFRVLAAVVAVADLAGPRLILSLSASVLIDVGKVDVGTHATEALVARHGAEASTLR